MFRVLIFLSLFFLNLKLISQERHAKAVLIYEVDSMVNTIKKTGIDQMVIYYSDGAIKTGIVLWKVNNVQNGIAFRKVSDKFEVENIGKKSINHNMLLKEFADSLELFQKPYLSNDDDLSHDFNLIWIYNTKLNVDTVTRKISGIVAGSDRIGREMYNRFENIYQLTMPPFKNSLRRKNVHGKNKSVKSQ